MSKFRKSTVAAAAFASLALPALALALWTGPIALESARPRAAAEQRSRPQAIEIQAAKATEASRAAVLNQETAAPIAVAAVEEPVVLARIERAPLESATIRPAESSELPPEVRARLESRLSHALAERPRPQRLEPLDRRAEAAGIARPLGDERVIDTALPRWAAPAELERKLDAARAP